eukprot:scaffold3.g6764.t1
MPLQLRALPPAAEALDEVFIPEPPTFWPNTAGWEDAGAQLGSASLLTLPAGAAPTDAVAAVAAALPAFAPKNDVTEHGGSSKIAELHAAYRSGRTTPRQVAERVIAAVAASEAQDPPMRFLVAHDPAHLRQQAAASSERWAAGRPLSVLDGVPFAAKDIPDAPPYPTTAGTAFMAGWRPPSGTNPAVRALLDAGALLVGKANTHEIGIGTTGLNTVTGTPRNPHNTAHHTGGSSSGSGGIVAAGICPIALACRVAPRASADPCAPWPPLRHAAPIDFTVCSLGPMAATVQDCLLMYAAMANQGHDPAPRRPPPLALPRLPAAGGDAAPLRGLRVGVYREWFEDAAPAVVAACRAALAALERAGAAVVPVRLQELDMLRAAHACTIVSEMRCCMTAALQAPAARGMFNLETRATLAVGAGFLAGHYVQARAGGGRAQKIRTRVESHFRAAFRACDLIASPTTPIVAPRIKPAALAGGESGERGRAARTAAREGTPLRSAPLRSPSPPAAPPPPLPQTWAPPLR